jgi:pimeloyl-ACP methyl ester carboxylesterase
MNILEGNIKNEAEFEYAEYGVEGATPIVLLHGLLGNLSNFQGIVDTFGKDRKIYFPVLPIFTVPIKKLGLGSLTDYIENFIEFKKLDKVHILGNSLGGHLAQLYTLRHPDRVESMILTGSSGLFENAMGSTFPKRGNYEYVKKKAEMVFYDPSVATKELVDEVFEIVNDIRRGIRIIITAKSAVRHNLESKLKDIKVPTLLVWGKDDTVTPDWVGEKFHKLIENSQLIMIDKCGHAPMMEKPSEFNLHLLKFLDRVEKEKAL